MSLDLKTNTLAAAVNDDCLLTLQIRELNSLFMN